MKKTTLFGKVGWPLGLLALGVGFLGIIWSGDTNDVFGDISATMFGSIFLFFHSQISDRFIALYPTTNKTFIRGGTIAIGIILVIAGLGSILGIIPVRV